MTKIFKHLAKHWAACLVIIALLLVQAYGDLTLPDYTSKIVDTGIQQSGIADAVPEVVRDSTLQVLELLMTDADAAAATAEQIRAVDGVDSCTYTMNDTGSALLSVSLSDLEGSDTCAQTVQALRDLLDGSGAYIYSAEGYSISDQINGEVRGLLVIVAIILVTVLTFTSSTYAEVPILLITFLAAALINKGTNFVFGTISFVSNAVAILLQLAMSVDYAIIFCNRYKQAHETLPVYGVQWHPERKMGAALPDMRALYEKIFA